ncbi:putative glycosyl transferase, family 8 [Helianthus anomalus]
MNIFNLRAWRRTNIRETYHTWLKESLAYDKRNRTFVCLGYLFGIVCYLLLIFYDILYHSVLLANLFTCQIVIAC